MDEVLLTPSTMLGAVPQGEGRCRFEVWAPSSERLTLVLDPGGAEREVPMQPIPHGYHVAVAEAGPGTRYVYRLPDGAAPDPASRWQPEGVHGPSAVFDPGAFERTDDGWTGLALHRSVTYELHVGTFTQEGTFDAATEATLPGGRWTRRLDSSEERWDGRGARSPDEVGGGDVVVKVGAGAFALYVRGEPS